MSETTYYQRNREVILNRAKEYYENNKELLTVRAKTKCRELSEKEKTIKRKYGRNRYHNMSEESKKRLKEYQKNYRHAKKKSIINNLFYSNQPRYCDVISSILSLETFNFFNMISFIFNSSSKSSI